jgi:hypothetical protein
MAAMGGEGGGKIGKKGGGYEKTGVTKKEKREKAWER